LHNVKHSKAGILPNNIELVQGTWQIFSGHRANGGGGDVIFVRAGTAIGYVAKAAGRNRFALFQDQVARAANESDAELKLASA